MVRIEESPKRLFALELVDRHVLELVFRQDGLGPAGADRAAKLQDVRRVFAVLPLVERSLEVGRDRRLHREQRSRHRHPPHGVVIERSRA